MPSTSSLPAPTTWSFDPAVVVGLILLLGAYVIAIGPLTHRLHPDGSLPVGRIIYFIAGWLTLALTLVSPLDTLGRYYLFSAHTAQLFLLTTLAAPLLLLGLPEWLVEHLLPTESLRNATRGLLFPILATIAFNGIILIWHIGRPYEAALRSTALHDLQSLSFLIAGLLTWWPLLTPLDRHTRLATPFQILYLTLESLPLDIFGTAIIFAPRVLYAAYAAAPRVSGLSALADQQFAGVILAVPGNIIDIGLMSVVFFAWLQNVERAQRERERLAFDMDDVEGDESPARENVLAASSHERTGDSTAN
ncbi:MAG: cytochrome c oxidase assembly protein [Ktedonobacterales bacterium]